MFTKIQSFKAWGFPQIVKDYEQLIGTSTSKAQLFAMTVFTQDFLYEITESVVEQIRDATELILIDLYHVSYTYLVDDIKTYIPALLESAGYVALYPNEDYQPYGSCLIYAYSKKEECE